MARGHLLMATALCLQATMIQTTASTPAVEGSVQDSLQVTFSFTGSQLADADSAKVRVAIAAAAGVQQTSVYGVKVAEAAVTDDAAVHALQAAATVTAVNLAAPYAALTGAAAADALAAQLQKLGAAYVPQSLQVDAPAWVVAAASPAPETASLAQFTMSGVALPDLNQIRLRAAIGSAAGVRLEQVTIVSLAYAVAAAGRRMLADGYHTLKVVAAVDRSAAAGAGDLLQGSSGEATLAGQLLAVLGATLESGSLQIIQPAGNSGGGSDRTMLALIITASVVLAATLATAAVFTFRYCRKKAAVEQLEGKPVEDNASVWDHPSYKGLSINSIAGAKPAAVPAPPAAVAQP